MGLPRQIKLVLLAVFVVACRDTSGPATTTGLFILHDINGRALPTFLPPTPGGTTTIVSGTLTLDGSGRASMTEHRIEWSGLETDTTVNYTYKITDRKIQFEMLGSCPPAAMCAGPPTGTISADGLTLTIDLFGSHTIFYDYSLGLTL